MSTDSSRGAKGPWVDPQTGVLGRDAFALLIEHHMHLADRDGAPFVVVFLSVEDVDRVRGDHGDEAADAWIRGVADVAINATRDADAVAHLGNGAFAVLLAGNADGAEPLVLARLVEGVAARSALEEIPIGLSVNVGRSRYDPRNPCGLEELLRRAEQDAGATPGGDGA
jgi:diguanylate cyclase (GGDEF)-like protein